MSTDRPYFVTTPIFYVKDTPHLGHAYPTVAADVLARFMRLDGKRVKFLTGTDEHGQKVERSAQALGLTPQQFADRVSASFREMDRLLNISFDDYIRTTEDRHIRGVQALWRGVRAGGGGGITRGAAISISAGLRACTVSATKPFTTKANSSTARHQPEPRSNGSRKRTISSAWQPGRTGCWRFTTPIPRRLLRAAGATRSSAL